MLILITLCVSLLATSSLILLWQRWRRSWFRVEHIKLDEQYGNLTPTSNDSSLNFRSVLKQKSLNARIQHEERIFKEALWCSMTVHVIAIIVALFFLLQDVRIGREFPINENIEKIEELEKQIEGISASASRQNHITNERIDEVLTDISDFENHRSIATYPSLLFWLSFLALVLLLPGTIRAFIGVYAVAIKREGDVFVQTRKTGSKIVDCISLCSSAFTAIATIVIAFGTLAMAAKGEGLVFVFPERQKSDPTNKTTIWVDTSFTAQNPRIPILFPSGKFILPEAVNEKENASSQQVMVQEFISTLMHCARPDSEVVIQIQGFASSARYEDQTDPKSNKSNTELANKRACTVRNLAANAIGESAIDIPIEGNLEYCPPAIGDHIRIETTNWKKYEDMARALPFNDRPLNEQRSTPASDQLNRIALIEVSKAGKCTPGAHKNLGN